MRKWILLVCLLFRRACLGTSPVEPDEQKAPIQITVDSY